MVAHILPNASHKSFCAPYLRCYWNHNRSYLEVIVLNLLILEEDGGKPTCPKRHNKSPFS